MGMFDTIMVWAECPYCGEHKAFNSQTKELNNTLQTYETTPCWDTKTIMFKPLKLKGLGYVDKNRLWDKAISPSSVESVSCIFDCHSSLCQWWADRRDVIQQGAPSGFGRTWHADIPIRIINGKTYFIGKMLNVKLDDLTEGKLRKYKSRLKEDERAMFYNALKKLKYEPLALRFMHRFGRNEK